MYEIPRERLPPGFAERLGEPVAEPAETRPAATVVLARDGDAGLEVLLLRRARSSGFVPGAYVFPGGRVDEQDADPRVTGRLAGLDPAAGGPGPAYLVAAVREAFEETGLLLVEGDPDADALRGWRGRLLAGEVDFAAVLEALDARIAAGRMAYLAHWITPEAEPRRYDTRFFLAAVPAGSRAAPDPREMTDAVWLAPAAALDRFQAGTLPMVFPTVRTLQTLAAFTDAAGAIAALQRREVAPVLPRLVRTARGVGIVVDPEEDEHG
jgi:8-oxo-dGTP pyrophosphatase MutT (NUDIX family)